MRWLQPGWDRLRVGEHSGIGFLDTSRAEQARRDFITRTTEALDLIRRVDPRRFERLRVHINYIVHQELAFAYAKYDGQLRACYVDFTQLHFDKHPEMMLWGYAAILVHEATHGVVQGFGIPSRRRNRERIERLCDAESARFLRHKSERAADTWDEIMNRSGRRKRLWAKPRSRGLIAVLKRRSNTDRRTNPQRGANGRQPIRSRTNRTSAAAASRRSPSR
jgi:hypothetical protein